jgi:hypothetical protein
MRALPQPGTARRPPARQQLRSEAFAHASKTRHIKHAEKLRQQHAAEVAGRQHLLVVVGVQFHLVDELIFPPSAWQACDNPAANGASHHEATAAHCGSHALVDAAVGVQLDARPVTLAVDPVATVPARQHECDPPLRGALRGRNAHAGLVELRVHGKSVPAANVTKWLELAQQQRVYISAGCSLPVAAHVAVDVIALVPAQGGR